VRASRITQLAKIIWAGPCSAVGLVLAGLVLTLGGRIRFASGILEATYRERKATCGSVARGLPFRAITFGHVVIAVTAQDLDGCRTHELVHVRQYERWGLLFFLAYPLSSLLQLLRGRRPYWDNRFEVEARQRCGETGADARDA